MGCFYVKRCWSILFCLIFIFALNGCVYEGPRATPSEVAAYEKQLMAEAIKYKVGLWSRVYKVGYHLLSYIPKKFSQGKFPYLGFIVLDNDENLGYAYHTPRGQCLILVSKIKGTSAQDVDVINGSVILAVDGMRVRSYRDYKLVVSGLRPGSYIPVDFWYMRGYQRYVKVDSKPVDINFYVSSDSDINAMATPSAVIVTYGMMQFIKSDDELAVVLGHEIAHILLAHHRKATGLHVVTGLLGSVLGTKLDEFLPGLGGMLTNMSETAIESSFSRDLERQADYWGLYLAYRAGYDVEKGAEIWERFAIEVPDSMKSSFWRTHPTSIERRVYIKKIINQFKQGIFPDNGGKTS